MYDTVTDTWCELRELPLDLIAPHATRIGDKLIVTGGGTSWNIAQQDTYISNFVDPVCKNDFDDLVTNGCFEDGAVESLNLTSWTVKNGETAKVVCSSQKAIALEGNCAFRFKGAVGEKNKLTQMVNLENVTIAAGDTLTLHGYVNAKKAETSGKVTVQIKYTDSNIPKGKITTNLVKTSGYQPLTGQLDEIVVSSSIEEIIITVKNQSPKGKVFIDAVRLLLTKGNMGGLISLP